MEFPPKLIIEPSYNPAIPHLGICPKKMQTLLGKDIFTPMFIAALCTRAKMWKQSQCPSIVE